jgi:hypothetical protein
VSWDKKIPFDKNGNMLSYAESSGYFSAAEWRDATPFKTHLVFSGYSRGRSSALMHFKDPQGKDYPMFMTDFSDVIKYMVQGHLEGYFEGVKRGANFGLRISKTDRRMTQEENK